jgi:4-hydroxybenzoate polyprenyltransferase
VTQWVLAVILLAVVVAVFWDVYARGKQGVQRVWWLSAAVAAGVAGILQGAGVDRPWPLVALMVFVVLLALANRADRRMESTSGR